jgi:hypothetical protein
MNWTNDKPTVPGWYRWRNQFGEISVVEVQRRLVPGLRVNGHPLELLLGQWEGPL